jgi:hypothetical protein
MEIILVEAKDPNRLFPRTSVPDIDLDDSGPSQAKI